MLRKNVRVFGRVCVVATSASHLCCVCPHISARLQLDGYSWNLILGTFAKSCFVKIPYLFKIGQKYRELYVNTQMRFEVFVLLRCYAAWICGYQSFVVIFIVQQTTVLNK